MLGKGAICAGSMRREVVHALALTDMPRSELEAHCTAGSSGAGAPMLDQVLRHWGCQGLRLPGLKTARASGLGL